MKKTRSLVILALFFLAQYVAPSVSFPDSNFLLPQIRTGAESPDPFFKQIYESICIGLSIYKLDAFERYTKDKLVTDFQFGTGKSVRFDMENMDIGRKGWTRYYPFSIGGKDFIMRIFLTEEQRYQPQARVLYEGRLENPAVTFQILPPLSELLSDCNIKPFSSYCPTQVDRSA